MSRNLRLAAAAGAVAAGALAILLGRSVLGERAALARADARLAVPARTSAGGGGAVSGFLLGTGADWTARRAAALAVRARSDQALAVAVRDHVRAEQELLPLASSGPGRRRSWAATLIAQLEWDQARLDPQGAKQHAARTLAALRLAVAADPANEDAKRDLELLLTGGSASRQSGGGHGRRPAAPRASEGGGRRRAGATLAPIGSGW